MILFTNLLPQLKNFWCTCDVTVRISTRLHTFLQFGHQIDVKIVPAGGGGFLLLAEDADHMIVQSQSVCHSEVTHSTFVVLWHIDRLAGVLTWWMIRASINQASTRLRVLKAHSGRTHDSYDKKQNMKNLCSWITKLIDYKGFRPTLHVKYHMMIFVLINATVYKGNWFNVPTFWLT